MRSWMTIAAEVSGMALIAVGAGLVFVPAGVIAAGAGLLVVGLLAPERDG